MSCMKVGTCQMLVLGMKRMGGGGVEVHLQAKLRERVTKFYWFEQVLANYLHWQT